jgi:hypothetical protein
VRVLWKADRMKRALWPLWQMWALAFYRRALREIDPMHADVPLIVLKINALERGM